ncbi:MAG: hypothetical protein Q8R36_00125 [bacterium]|nr:hypothetical protein [bacterium]
MTKQLDPNEKSMVSNKKVIGFDMDGVLIDFSELKRDIAALHGFPISLTETPSDIVRNIIPKIALDKIKEALFMYGPRRHSLPLMKGAKDGLEYFKKMEIPIVLISRRKLPAVAEELLKRHELWPTYFNEQNSFFVKSREEKDIVAKSQGVTHYVDDEPSVIDVLHSVKNRILFDPLSAYSNDDSYTRCISWDELKNILG